MRKAFLTLFALLNFFLLYAQPTTKSPEQYLGYTLGDRFTRHHKVVEYFEHVANTSPKVNLQYYGETNEHRPLLVAIVASEINMARLEEIRTNNLKRSGLEKGGASNDPTAIVWLSYNVHGNEASSIEASMKTLYALITEERGATWLQNTVVIIDPCVNPDGRDRYDNFYNQYGDNRYNPNGDAMEHHEPWPGGRPNHYLFDLNRDWAWQTQVESSQRSVIYHQWMPHIHVDFHEQYVNNPYYFAPAAEPFHEVITPWQREFQTAIGKNHAKYFDANHWLYFTKQYFDLLYPSYGDTYPTYNGAIGMTYEQAGHGYAGLGIITEYGDTLTLDDRIQHHFTTGMSTVEITSQHADRVVKEFASYFDQNMNNPAGQFKSYVVKVGTKAGHIEKLTRFLDQQHIRYGNITSPRTIKGFGYKTNAQASIQVDKNDLVISTNQPMSRLVTTLFEPVVKLSDTLTYDITAWALPYAYGLDAYAVSEKLPVTEAYIPPSIMSIEMPGSAYAYALPYQGMEDAKLMAALIQKGVNLRVAHKPLTINGTDFGRGTLIITRRNNEKFGSGFDSMLQNMAKQHQRQLMPLTTGFAEHGVDLGSADVARLAPPRVAVLGGEQTSSLNFGEIWHFFEKQLEYPITNIGTSYFSSIDLSAYDVLIIPHGYYSLFDEATLKSLTEWVQAGGKVVAIGKALDIFKGKEDYSLKQYASEEAQKKYEKDPTLEEQLKDYASQERDELSGSIFGAVFKIKLDNTNPLAYGYDRDYFTLKTTNQNLAYLKNGGNVGTLQGQAKPISGFAGYKATDKLQNSLVFGVENVGEGQVVYLVDNPLFRGFWENGKLLFTNAVFMVGN